MNKMQSTSTSTTDDNSNSDGDYVDHFSAYIYGYSRLNSIMLHFFSMALF